MSSARRSLPAVFALAIAMAAAAPQPLAAIPGPSRTTVGYAEIAAATQTNVYDLLRAHRPLWLHMRGVGRTGADVMVYLDGNRLGGIAELSRIPTAIVTGATYMDAREATTKLGADHGSGAILLSTDPVVEGAVLQL